MQKHKDMTMIELTQLIIINNNDNNKSKNNSNIINNNNEITELTMSLIL